MNKSNQLALIVATICGATSASFDFRRRHLNSLRAVWKSPLVFLDVLSTALAAAILAWALYDALFLHSLRAVSAILQTIFMAAIFVYLWGEGRRANQFQRPNGIVLGEFLVLAGIADVVLASVEGGGFALPVSGTAGAIAGGLVLGWVVPRFMKKREEHHILDRIKEQGEAQQPEYTPPTEECPHPERWTMLDSMSAEVEILEFLKQIVLTLKPELIVETGTFIGASTIRMAEGLRENGFGKIVTCEFDPVVFAKAKERIDASGLGKWIEARNQSSLEMKIEGTIDLFFSDSHVPIREEEIRRFLPQIDPNGLILMHDASSHYKIAREAAFRLEQEGLISMVLLPTPRGLMMGQKRAGRK
jgi:predicted O-methyltransferase YrrM